MVERIVFFVLSLAFFLFLFFKMIKKNDTNYIYILAFEVIGIAISFISILLRVKLNIVLMLISYLISVILPLIVIIIEKTGISLTEAIYITLSKFYFKHGDEDKARKVLLSLVEKMPESYFAHKELAKIYELEENDKLALDEYIRVLNMKPGQMDICFKVANLFYKTGEKDEAVPLLTDLLKKKPDFLDASYLLGNIYYDKEMFKEAVSVYLNAMKYYPDDYDLCYNLGMVYTMLNDFKSAKEYYEKAAQINSLEYHAKYKLGQIALLYNELDEAEEYFEECLQDEELEEDAYFYLAYIAMLRGDENRAIVFLNTAVGDNPEMYDKIRKEIVFNVILAKIDKPKVINTENKPVKKKPKISEKELKTIKHLKDTYDLVRNLNNSDLMALNNILDKRKDSKEKDRNKEKECNEKIK